MLRSLTKGLAPFGLVVALLLGIYGYRALKSKPIFKNPAPPAPSVLDAQAAPHFRRALGNIPGVVEQLSGIKNTGRLCYLMARDRLSGTRRTQEYIQSVIDGPIMGPCREGAKVYQCVLKSTEMQEYLTAIGKNHAAAVTNALQGLALEAVFFRSTMASLRRVLGAIAVRMGSSVSAGLGCAAADGPFPFGDALGALIAVAGTATCGYDLYMAQKTLPGELSVALHEAVVGCQNSCREAYRKAVAK